MRINKTAILTMGVLFSLHGFADVASSFAQYSGDAKGMNNMLQVNGGTISVKRVVNGQNQTQSFQAGDVPNAQAKPAETSYYGKTDQEITNAAGQALANQDPKKCTSQGYDKNHPNADLVSGCSAISGNTVATNFTSAPKFTIDPTSPSIARSILIQADAENIAQGKPGKYFNCQKQDECHVTYTNQTCTEQHQLNLSCTNNYTPEIISNSYTTECDHMAGDGFNPSFVPGPSGGWCYIPIISYNGGAGRNLHINGSRQFSLPPNTEVAVHMFFRPLDHDWDFNSRWGNVYFSASGTGLPSFYYLNPPFAGNAHGNVLWQEGEQNFTTAAGNQEVPFTYNYSMVSENIDITGIRPGLLYIRYPESALTQVVVKDRWTNSCPNTQALSQCSQLTNACTQGAETREMGHKDITAECWQYTSTYQCGQNSNSCSSIKGCDQTNSQCAVEVAGTCLSYTNTYRCPQTQCTSEGMICGGDFFCIKGDCSETTPTGNDNFGKDDAEMAAVTDGMTQMIGRDDIKAFTGQAMSCRKDALDFANCCSDSGWGIDIHLGSCNQQEKDLGTAKGKGVVEHVGSFCAKKVLGMCVVHGEAYCTFPDVLSYDIQDQGRKNQLHRGFGSGDNPDCSGLTVDDLQKIDFSKINFQNVIQQITDQAKFPNSQSVQDAIQKEIANHVRGKQ